MEIFKYEYNLSRKNIKNNKPIHTLIVFRFCNICSRQSDFYTNRSPCKLLLALIVKRVKSYIPCKQAQKMRGPASHLLRYFLKQSGFHTLNASNSLQGGGPYQNIIIQLHRKSQGLYVATYIFSKKKKGGFKNKKKQSTTATLDRQKQEGTHITQDKFWATTCFPLNTRLYYTHT